MALNYLFVLLFLHFQILQSHLVVPQALLYPCPKWGYPLWGRGLNQQVIPCHIILTLCCEYILVQFVVLEERCEYIIGKVL